MLREFGEVRLCGGGGGGCWCAGRAVQGVQGEAAAQHGAAEVADLRWLGLAAAALPLLCRRQVAAMPRQGGAACPIPCNLPLAPGPPPHQRLIPTSTWLALPQVRVVEFNASTPFKTQLEVMASTGVLVRGGGGWATHVFVAECPLAGLHAQQQCVQVHDTLARSSGILPFGDSSVSSCRHSPRNQPFPPFSPPGVGAYLQPGQCAVHAARQRGL